MIWLTLFFLSQSSADTLRWYDTTTIGHTALGFTSGGYMHWAIVLPIDSSLDGREIYTGRVHISEPMDSLGILRFCLGTGERPITVLDSGYFRSVCYGFYEVRFWFAPPLRAGDTVWLWCTQWHRYKQYPATSDDGKPVFLGYSDMASFDDVVWWDASDISHGYNWIMEIVLLPSEVEEEPAKHEGKITLLPASGGFWVTGYSGPTQIYDPAGRLVLKKEIRGKTLISPLRPGVYFVVAENQRARVAIR